MTSINYNQSILSPGTGAPIYNPNPNVGMNLHNLNKMNITPMNYNPNLTKENVQMNQMANQQIKRVKQVEHQQQNLAMNQNQNNNENNIESFKNKDNSFWHHVKKHFDDIIRMDKKRIYEILELIQYSVIYAVITFFVANFMDNYLFEPRDPNKTYWQVFRTVIFEIVLIILTVFYQKKIVKMIPFIFHKDPDYKRSKLDKYFVLVTISLAILRSNLKDKLQFLERQF